MVATSQKQQEKQALVSSCVPRLCFCHVCDYTFYQSKTGIQGKILPFNERKAITSVDRWRRMFYSSFITCHERVVKRIDRIVDMVKFGGKSNFICSLPLNTCIKPKLSIYKSQHYINTNCFKYNEESE